MKTMKEQMLSKYNMRCHLQSWTIIFTKGATNKISNSSSNVHFSKKPPNYTYWIMSTYIKVPSLNIKHKHKLRKLKLKASGTSIFWQILFNFLYISSSLLLWNRWIHRVQWSTGLPVPISGCFMSNERQGWFKRHILECHPKCWYRIQYEPFIKRLLEKWKNIFFVFRRREIKGSYGPNLFPFSKLLFLYGRHASTCPNSIFIHYFY